jgi:hypothetical protein
MVILLARLDAVAGAAVVRALDAAAEALYERARTGAEGSAANGAERPANSGNERSACRDSAGHELAPGQRRADALVLLAESALAGGLDLEFRTPHGRLLPEAPAPPHQPIDPFEALLKQLEDGAIVVDPYTGTPLWDGSPPDLGLAVEWFLTRTAKHTAGEKGDNDEPGGNVN